MNLYDKTVFGDFNILVIGYQDDDFWSEEGRTGERNIPMVLEVRIDVGRKDNHPVVAVPGMKRMPTVNIKVVIYPQNLNGNVRLS